MTVETTAQEPLFDLEPQRNQTREHWWLSWAARVYLLGQGAYYAGMEVAFWEERPLIPDNPDLAHFTTQVGTRLDVLAIMRLYDASSRRAMPILTDEGRELVTVAAEAKASRADFRQGFNDDVADFNYLVYPAGLLESRDVPDYVGLLIYHDGLEMRRRATRIGEPQLTVEDAIYPIAASCAREVRRMRPRIVSPFGQKREDEG